MRVATLVKKPAKGAAREGSSGLTDDELYARYCRGDDDAFSRLYERYRGRVYRYFLRQVTPNLAQDLYQETWMKLIKAVASYEPRGTFAAYLFKLAHNVLMDHYRRETRQNTIIVEEGVTAEALVTEDADPDRQLDRAEMARRLQREISRLPVDQRTTWLIRQESGLDLKTIAAITGTSVEGVKSRLRYANAKLKAGMQRHVRS